MSQDTQNRIDEDAFETRVRTPALMVLGTASHVGKSLVATAFCRLLADRGVRVAPFKAQNMSLNSDVTPAGGEIGRAQSAQAEASGIASHVDMNPILLKPSRGVSQVVLLGEPIGVMSARDYYAAKERLWPQVTAAYDRLAARFEVIVLEGAGSPVEINLMEHDLTNLYIARYADASIVLVADIERGGVFAQIVGTWELLPEVDRARVIGFIINKFRGDPSLLDSGLAWLEERIGVPVLGVLPYLEDVLLDQEDSLGIDATASPAQGRAREPRVLDIAVIRLPSLSNFSDFAPLARAPMTHVHYVSDTAHLVDADIIILPGSKSTMADLVWLRERGLAGRIVALAQADDGPLVLGVCGGFQMLGGSIDDPSAVESPSAHSLGLGLLDLATTFGPIKDRYRVRGTAVLDGLSIPIQGYEIHMGKTTLGSGLSAWMEIDREPSGERSHDGAVDASGRIFGTYLHGLFDEPAFLEAWLGFARRRRGLPNPADLGGSKKPASVRDPYVHLAMLLREHLDLRPVWSALGMAE